LGAGDIDVEGLKSRADAADEFAGPEGSAEQCDPAVAGLADGAKGVAWIGRLVGVQTAVGELSFEIGIFVLCGGTNAKAEGFGFEAGEQLTEEFEGRLGNDQATGGGFAAGDAVRCAKIADALEVAKEIHDEGFRRGKSEQGRGPDGSGFGTAEGFAAFGFDEFEANGLDPRAEVHGLDVEGIGRKIGKRFSSRHDYS